MSDKPQPRQATINRDSDGTVLAAVITLDKKDLNELGIETEKFDSVEYVTSPNGVEVYGGELRDPKKLDAGIVLKPNDVPKELTKSEVEHRYPDEQPTDYGEYWERQRLRAMSEHGLKCEFCGATHPDVLSVVHIHDASVFETLKAAHDITNLQVSCGDCRSD